MLRDFIKNIMKFIPKNFDINHDLQEDIIKGQFKDNDGLVYIIKFTIDKIQSKAFLRIEFHNNILRQEFTLKEKNGEYLLYYEPSGFSNEGSASLADSFI